MNFGILEALLIPEIATEADDITKQVNDIMGGKKAPAENKSNDQRDEDLTQTDNIFDDIQKDDAEDNPQNNPTDTDDQSQDKTDTSDDSQGENDNNSNLKQKQCIVINIWGIVAVIAAILIVLYIHSEVKRRKTQRRRYSGRKYL